MMGNYWKKGKNRNFKVNLSKGSGEQNFDACKDVLVTFLLKMQKNG